MPELDFTKLPDQEQPLDFSLLPDQSGGLDFSRLPDQPSVPTAPTTVAEPSFMREVVGETAREFAEPLVGTVEGGLAVASGITQFFGGLPAGLYGIAKGIQTGSMAEAEKGVETVQAAISPLLAYRPTTLAGQRAQKTIEEALDWLIGTPARLLGEAAQEVVGPVAGETAGAAAGTAVQTVSELAAFGTLFKGLHATKTKVMRGDPLTRMEEVRMEDQIVEVAEKLKQGERTGEIVEKPVAPRELITEVEPTVGAKIPYPEGFTAQEWLRSPYPDVRSASQASARPAKIGWEEGRGGLREILVEPEVAKAVTAFTEKGHQTSASGWPASPPGREWGTSHISFARNLPNEVVNRLVNKGLIAANEYLPMSGRQPLPELRLDVSGLTVEQIKGRWDAIASEVTGRARFKPPGKPRRQVAAGKPPKPAGARVMDLIRTRRAEIDKGILDSEAFIIPIENSLRTAELEAIPFIRQGIKSPQVLVKIGREDLIPIIQNPSKAVLDTTKKIGKYYDEAHAFLQENYGDVGFIEDYVTQIWEVPKARRAEALNYFTTHNPFTKKRTIPTLEEGIKLGLKPKFLNIADLLRIYDQFKIKTVHNLKFAESLKKMKWEDGEPVMKRIDKAPVDWVTIEHPALSRAMSIGKIGEEGLLLRKVPVKVHPEIAREVKVIFDKPFSHKAIQAYETLNAFAKKGMLSVTLFHHFALTESAFSTGIGRKAIALWNPYKVYNAVKNRDFDVFRRMPLAKDALDHGVTFGALSDVQRGRVRTALENAERSMKEVPVLRTGTKVLRKANDLWDTALWDYYHNALKLYAYEENVLQGLKGAERRSQRTNGRSLNPEEITAVKRQLADFVNDSFGGQNWDLQPILGNPKTRQMLHWVFLAPDWTISVLKQGAAPVKGMVKAARGATAQERMQGQVLARRSSAFWIKAALYYNLIAQSVNWYAHKRDFGEGRYTWQNDPGQELNVYLGQNPDGTKRYVRMGKQFREVMEWGFDPSKKMGYKMSPVLREAVTQITKHDPGSGFPTDFADKEFWESLPDRLLSVAETPIPFSLRPFVTGRPKPFLFTLPTTKGMTNYKAVKYFKEALRAGNDKRIKRIYISSLENNLDAESLLRSAASSVKADMTYDNKRLARDILSELKDVDQEAKRDLLKHYGEKGILTPEVAEQLRKLIDTEIRVQQQQELHGIEVPQ